LLYRLLVGGAAVRGVGGGDMEGKIWAATSSHFTQLLLCPVKINN